jgi:cathepsin L
MKMLMVFVLFTFLTTLVVGRTEEEYETAFEEWVQEHHKVYDDREVLYRFRIFKQSLDWIESFNSEPHSFTVGLNSFSDLTNTEFLERYTGLNRKKSLFPPIQSSEHLYEIDESVSVPTAIDWRSKGIVTPVKTQGQCGSCWSFSTTGSVEGAWARNHSLVSLSEQNLMDCSRSYGNVGCNGGLMDGAFKYIINNQGIDSEASYPYTGYTSYNCQYSPTNKAASITGYKDIPSGSESGLKNAVGIRGPVSVAIDASQPSFQYYKGGVYYDSRCSSTSLDHGVLVVGYGTGTGGDYWIVKNSWGPGWGVQGYIYMSRNKNNNCGIATDASFPIV